ncbi:MAG: HD domain-containing protein [Oscillospiraceae bacterium]|nr:HD domain-containing protein [Oscillospiraceae bacterium]
MQISYEQIKQNPDIQEYINHADKSLETRGYTEHSNAHAELCADTACGILQALGYAETECRLAQISGYLHDIGNCINRSNHAHTGALLAQNLLAQLGMPASEIALIMSAIGHHDELTAVPVNPVAAAVILADKMDVRRSRVRFRKSRKNNAEPVINDIHDRVNYACVQARHYFSDDKTELFLDLIIDEKISPVIEYFEIFLQRMSLCRLSAEALGVRFRLVINNGRIV